MKHKNQIILATLELTFLILAVIFITNITGCNNGNNPMQPGNSSNNLDLSAVGDNNNTVGNIFVISEAKVMVKDMKIEMEEAGGGEGEDENIKIGPFVIDLQLNSQVNIITTAQLKTGNYRKVKFEIHKLAPNEITPDPDFVDANGSYSVVVKGIYNGVSFIYKSKVSANQKLNLQKILSISANRTNNITFFASPLLWFYDDNGNLLDPALEINRHFIDDNIRDNIKHNLRIFVDDDHDGKPDN